MAVRAQSHPPLQSQTHLTPEDASRFLPPPDGLRRLRDAISRYDRVPPAQRQAVVLVSRPVDGPRGASNEAVLLSTLTQVWIGSGAVVCPTPCVCVCCVLDKVFPSPSHPLLLFGALNPGNRRWCPLGLSSWCFKQNVLAACTTSGPCSRRPGSLSAFTAEASQTSCSSLLGRL